jgi:hypothetical protein
MSKQAADELFKLGLSETADMGVTYSKDEYTPEAKARINSINKTLKPLQKKGEKYLADGGDEFDPEFLEMYDKGISLEKELRKILENDDSYISKAGEIHHVEKLDCFTNVLRAIQMNTHIDTRQLEILIALDYFRKFGKSGKLMKIYNEFFSGEKNLKNKNLKSFEERLVNLRSFEKEQEDKELPVDIRLRNEFENIGLCLSLAPNIKKPIYFVQSVNDKYSIRVKVYKIRKGNITELRIAKKDYEPISVGSCIRVDKYRESKKYTYRNGQKTIIPGEKEFWVSEYKIMGKGEVA